MRIVNIWGLPLRLINWSIAILLAVCFVTATAKGSIHTLHVGAGYALSVALIYRIVLGFIGGPTARFTGMMHPFSRFADQARAFIDYRIQRWSGHSPIGGMTAMVMIYLLGFAVISGMIALNGVDATKLHAMTGLSATIIGMTWLGFTLAYQIFYDRSTLRTLLSGRRIISDAERSHIAIPRLNRAGMNATAFGWAMLLSAAILPLTYVTPAKEGGKYDKVAVVQDALKQAPYVYDEARASSDVLPQIHEPVFAINKVRVTWQPSITAGIDYARPGYIPGANEFLMAEDNTPDSELGSIETAAGGADGDAIPVRAQPVGK